MTDFSKAVMQDAINYARITSNNGIGGPFGAAVVKDGKVICIESNRVLADKDPTAHAEITAIRRACEILDTHDLSGCELYATGEPCPMCISAIIWSNIKTVYYCNDVEAAERIGFRDDFIYNYIRGGCVDGSVVHVYHTPLPEGGNLYEEYKRGNKQMY